MTGCLHIPDDEDARYSIVETAHDWIYPGCQHSTGPGWECERFADLLLSVLRGLSVEPIEREAVQRVRQWCEFHRANYNGAPAERLSSSYRDAPLLLADLESLVAAPVPVQEDRR